MKSICRVIPKSRRAKNRVREHGELMEIVREMDSVSCCQGKKGTLVRALNTPEGKEPWMGWFCVDEAEIHEEGTHN
jgi:hypothetical protein